MTDKRQFRQRPRELWEMHDLIVDHIVQNYHHSWSVWARPDLNNYLPPSDEESAGEDDEDDGDGDDPHGSFVPPPPTTPPLSPSRESSRSRKRTTEARSPASPDEQAKIRSSKRTRGKKSEVTEEAPNPPAKPPVLVIPQPFPSSLSISKVKEIRNARATPKWAAAALEAGVIADPVRFLLATVCLCLILRRCACIVRA